MAMTQLPSDFKEFLKLANLNKVEYLLIGGHAVMYHGHPRNTADMDIWIAVDPVNAARVAETLQQFGFGTVVSPEMFLEANKVFRMGIPPVRIELLTNPSGVDFATAYPRRVYATMDGVAVPIISLEDLKANKKASGRAKDLADLENLP
jgi:hypothetical protein